MPCSRSVRDRAAQLAGADRVDADRRLVEEEHLGVVQQPAGDVQPLPHAAGEALDALLLAAGEADHLEQVADPLPLLARGDAVQLGEVAQVVERVEPFVEAAVAAEDVADVAADLAGVGDHVVPEHPRRARRWGAAA